MSFDELLDQLDQRLFAFQETGDPALVLGEETTTLAQQLRVAADSLFDDVTDDQQSRLAQAWYSLGWFHYARLSAFLRGNDPTVAETGVEMASALVFLRPVANNPLSVPEPLRALVGPEAVADDQLRFGLELLETFGDADDNDPVLLDAAIDLLADALDALDPDHPDRPVFLASLTAAYQARYEIDADPDDLDQVIEVGLRAEAGLESGHPIRETLIPNLVGACHDRFESTGAPADLDLLIELGLKSDHQNRPGSLVSLCTAYATRFELAHDVADLDRAVAAGTEAMATLPDGHHAWPGLLANLGAAHFARYHQHDDLDDLDRMVWLGERAVRLAPPDHASRPTYLSNLLNAYGSRYRRTHDVADLDQAALVGAANIDAVPEDHPDLLDILLAFGEILGSRYLATAQPADRDTEIDVRARALAITPPDHSTLIPQRTTLSGDYLDRYQQTDDHADLDRALDLDLGTLRIMPPGHPDRTRMISGVSTMYRLRYNETKQPDDLTNVLEFGEQAVAATSVDDLKRASRLSNLASALQIRYERDGDPEDLERAIALRRELVDTTPADDPRRGEWLAALANGHLLRYELRDEAEDLDLMIDTTSSAVAVMTDGDRPALLHDLATAHRRRYTRDNRLADLESAIEANTEAAATGSPGDRAAVLSYLASDLQDRYERLNTAADLDRAIDTEAEAVAAAADGQSRGLYLGKLGFALRTRYLSSGNLPDLDRAIDAMTEAVPLVSAERRSWTLSNLGTSLRLRYRRRGVSKDLDRAIEAAVEALAVAAPDDDDRRPVLINLGNSLRTRYERLSAPSDLDRAVEVFDEVLAATPAGHPDRTMALTNLGITLHLRYRHSGRTDDLDREILLKTEAAASSHSQGDRAIVLSNLGTALLSRYETAGAADDLDRGVSTLAEASTLIPDGHPAQAMVLANLADAYRSQIDGSQVCPDSATVRELAARVKRSTASTPSDRIHACHWTARLADRVGEHRLAVELFDEAVTLLPSVPPRESGWADQEHGLARHAGLVGDAVEAHCAVDDPAGAVAVAESGRAVLLAAQLQSRGDLTDLEAAHPDIAARLRGIREGLNTGHQGEDITVTNERRRLWADHDALLGEIRALPGFGDFLAPPNAKRRWPEATGGALVLVNVGSHRGDAVIVTADNDPVQVKLPGLTPDALRASIVSLLVATHGDSLALRRNAPRVLTELLGWLWDHAVAPILEKLPTQENRVWWMPTGMAGLLPLHAAGHPGQPGALDRVVSSYTPTVRVLEHARARPRAYSRRQLVVALEHTSGLRKLPGTVTEARALHARQPAVPPLLDHDATTTGVLAALPFASWVHFACHAMVDPETPSRSGLHLYDRILPLPEISRLRLADAELAYLSACSTAVAGPAQPDEALHLSSAFQLAGFRHVIASLWPVADSVAARAADSFYERLGDASTADRAASVLREISLELRASHPDAPHMWAPLIHSGP
nr:CHAT domain-containing protein [Kibdelosporangium sp. MJ126-NF4]CEL15596.1 hypothetical protein [Kibdelosporangium sp. MJ126-NF4]